MQRHIVRPGGLDPELGKRDRAPGGPIPAGGAREQLIGDQDVQLELPEPAPVAL